MGTGTCLSNFQWCASSKIRHSPAFPCHSEAMYAVSFGNCLRWMGCDGSAICWRTVFQNSNLSFTAIQINFAPQFATMNCTVPVCMSSLMRLWSRCLTRPPCNVPLSSQSSVSGNFVTIRWSGFNPSAFRPSSRIYHDFGQVPICRQTRQVPPPRFFPINLNRAAIVLSLTFPQLMGSSATPLR